MRRQFEKEYAKHYQSPCQFERHDKSGDYVDVRTRAGWRMWQASRAALVVELPDPHAHLIWIQAGYAPDDYWDDVEVSRSEKDRCCDGSERYPVYSEFEVAEMLKSAGITVKEK